MGENMANKKVSVIVPVYGTEKYVDKCLNSILNQTYSDFEILVVNDRSIDYSKMHICNIATIDSLKNQLDNVYNENAQFMIRVKVNIEAEQQREVYLLIKSAMSLNQYFDILDDLVQMLLLDKNEKSKVMYYTIDECMNFCKVNNFDITNVYDNVKVEIRNKSYAINSSLTRIKYIEHYQNEGLYQARLTGYEYASGKYITTIDSDD